MVHIIPQTVPICEYLEVFSGVHFNTTDQHKDLRPTSTARDGIHYTSFKDYLAHHSPFIYSGKYMDRLVCISTGIVDPATANADRANEPGELAADQLTGKNYADVKLERNDKVISIGVATNGAEVRGCQVEINTLPLFFVPPVSYVDVTEWKFISHTSSASTRHPFLIVL